MKLVIELNEADAERFLELLERLENTLEALEDHAQTLQDVPSESGERRDNE
tara:strand:+ start:3995 stop:4147 length:153 start_codon:yes stop_codon:yes gene_type:complete